HAARRASPYGGGGDDVFLSIVDEDGRPAGDPDHVASIDILATNRNLADGLPFGGGRPALSLEDASGVAACACLAAPTRALRPRRGKGALWRLVSHLSLNHLSVAEDARAVDILKEMMALYDHGDASTGRPLVERLTSVRSKPGVARSPGGGRIAFTSG